MSYPPMRHSLVDYHGDLCVLHERTLDSEPTILRLWWPTGQRTARVLSSYQRDLLGQMLDVGPYIGDSHGYTFCDRSMPQVTIQLRDRGRTEAIHHDEVPAPMPTRSATRGKTLRWHNGQWQRELASGWQDLGCTFPPVPLRTE
jgi:hypothetical protein